MKAYRKHIWSIIISIPLFFYSSQTVLELETKGDYGLVNNVCWGITGASGMIIINSLLALHFMAEKELVTLELSRVTEHKEGVGKDNVRENKAALEEIPERRESNLLRRGYRPCR